MPKCGTESDADYFADALDSVFGVRMPAQGDPGSTGRYENAGLPTWCADGDARFLEYRIADQSGDNTRLFAHYQWDAGVYLADLLAEGSARAEGGALDVRGRRVVELGAGTGLPGLVAAASGAAETVITDYPDVHVLSNLRHNLAQLQARAAAHGAPVDRASVAGLAWGDEAQERAVRGASTGFDLVLAADVLWVSSQHAALLHTIRAMLAHTPEARCVLVAGFHTGRPAVTRFLRAATAELALDAAAPHGGLYERRFSGEVRPWQGPPLAAAAAEDEEMGEPEERARWVMIAVLRWPA